MTRKMGLQNEDNNIGFQLFKISGFEVQIYTGRVKYSRVLILSWEKEYLQANRLQTDCSFNF